MSRLESDISRNQQIVKRKQLEDISDAKLLHEDSLLPEQDDLMIKDQLPDKPSLLMAAILADTQPYSQQLCKTKHEEEFKDESEEAKFKRKSKMFHDAVMQVTMESLVFKLSPT